MSACAMNIGVAFALVGGANAGIDYGASYKAMWAEYKNNFAKDYHGEVEDLKRFNAFSANMDIIIKHNTKNLSFKFGVNSFTDLTQDEFVSTRLGYVRPTQPYGDAPYLGEHKWNGEALPDAVDWVTKGAVTPIKDQGHCGSCWIFSAIGALEGAYEIATGSLVSLAEQQILDCLHSWFPPTMGCSGGSMDPVFNYAKDNNICTEKSYPYKAVAGTCAQAGCTTGMAKGHITGYKNLAWVPREIPASIGDMMSAVAQQPVSVSLEADKDVFHHYTSGVVHGDCGDRPDHGVLVVGYGMDLISGLLYWKVKNSWGPSWGEAGYVRVQRNKTSWPISYGECAILNGPSYPIAIKSATNISTILV